MINIDLYRDFEDKLSALNLYVPENDDSLFFGPNSLNVFEGVQRNRLVDSVRKMLKLSTPQLQIVRLSHFTKVETLGKIIQSGYLRSSSIESTNLSSEYNWLYNELGLGGFNQNSKEKVLAELRRSFFTSFVYENQLTEASIEQMNSSFGSVRISFEWFMTDISYKYFTNVTYPSPEQMEILIALTQLNIGGRQFVLPEISKLGFFLLTNVWSDEKEVRLLIPFDNGLLGSPHLNFRSGDFIDFLQFGTPTPIGRLELSKIYCENKDVFHKVLGLGISKELLSIEPKNSF